MKSYAYAAAIRLAASHHMNQFTLDGGPYILHPIHVSTLVHTETEKVVAVCHDLIEDTSCSMDDILKLVLPSEPEVVTGALNLLTHVDGEDYEEYIQEICYARFEHGRVARKVKLADLSHNMDSSRIPRTHPKRKKYLDRIETRYRPAYKNILKIAVNNLEALPKHD